MTNNTQVEDVLIIGSGPAGLTAAIYTARANLNPLVLEGRQPGGQLTITTEVENYPGFTSGVNGPDLMDATLEQAKRFGARCRREEVIDVNLHARPFSLETDKEKYMCKTLIIASGASAQLIGIPSENRFMGRGVSACATCDGFFFREQEVMIVGGGDSACEEALFLTKFAKRVRLLHRRDQLRASKIMQEKVFNNPKIEVIWNVVIDEILGEDPKGVSGVNLKNTITGELSEEKCDGIFIAIGHKPNTAVFKDYLEMDAAGYLLTQEGSTATNIPGVFAAGDVQDSKYRQAITAAGSGCMAALDAAHFLEEKGAIA